MKRCVIAVLLSAAMLVAEYAGAFFHARGDSDYEFYDRMGELKLLGKEDSLSIERVDESEKRQITVKYKPDVVDAFFSADGRYVVYKTIVSEKVFMGQKTIVYGHFIQPVDKSDTQRIEIDAPLYRDMKRERIRTRYKTE